MILQLLLFCVLVQQPAATPVASLPACREAIRGKIMRVADSSSDVTGDPIIGGGDKRVIAVCATDSLLTEKVFLWRVLIKDWQESPR